MLGKLSMLNKEEIEELHRASLHILQHVGIEVESANARNFLCDAGAKLQSNRIFLPNEMVEQVIKANDSPFLLYARDPKNQVIPGLKGKPLLANTGFCSYVYDTFEGQIRESTCKDCEEFALVCDFFPSMEFYTSIILPMDCPIYMIELYALYYAFLNTSKHIHCCCSSPRSARQLIELGSLVAGGKELFCKKPLFSAQLPALTSLHFSDRFCETTIELATHSIPILSFCSLLMGFSSPNSVAGTLALSNAQLLALLSLIKSVNPKATLFYATDTCATNPSNGTVDYNCPEYLLFAMANRQLANYYGMVSATSHDCSENFPSGVTSLQSSYLRQLRNILTLSDIAFSAGSKDSSLFASLTDLVLNLKLFEGAKPLFQERPLFSQGSGNDFIRQLQFYPEERNFDAGLIAPLLDFSNFYLSNHLEGIRSEIKSIINNYIPKRIDPKTKQSMDGMIQRELTLGE